MSWEEWLKTKFENMEGEILLFFTQWMYTYKYIYECMYIHTYICIYTCICAHIDIYTLYYFMDVCVHVQVYVCVYTVIFQTYKCYCDWVNSAYRQIWIFSEVLFIILYSNKLKKKCSYPIHKKVNEFFVFFCGLVANCKLSPSLTPSKSFRNTHADAVSLVLKAPPPDFFP